MSHVLLRVQHHGLIAALIAIRTLAFICELLVVGDYQMRGVYDIHRQAFCAHGWQPRIVDIAESDSFHSAGVCEVGPGLCGRNDIYWRPRRRLLRNMVSDTQPVEADDNGHCSTDTCGFGAGSSFT